MIKSKCQITFLIPRLGIIDRGAEVFVYELVKNLPSKFRVTVIVEKSTRRSDLIEELKLIGVKICHVSCISSAWPVIKFIYGFKILKPFLEKYHLNPDEFELLTFSIFSFPKLLFSDSDLLFAVNGIWGAIACRLIRLFKGIPFVYSTQGGREPLIAGQKPDAYIAFNNDLYNWLKESYPKLKSVMIPCGIDIKQFSPIGEKIKLSLPRPVFLTVSAFVPQKRIDLTIKAVAKLKRGSLLIVGKGPLKDDLQKLTDKLLDPRRILFWETSHQNMPAVYRAADVFTLASPLEPFGLVYLEALASGLPVVAHDNEHFQNIIGRAGNLCDVNNTEKYALALDKTAKTKWANIPRRQATKFAWDKIYLKYSELFLKLIESKS